MSLQHIHLAEYPNPNSGIAFKVPSMEGVHPAHYPAYGEHLRDVMARVGRRDPQVDIVADLYTNGVVFRENVPHLEGTITALERGDGILAELHRLEETSQITEADARHWRTALGNAALAETSFLTPDGFAATLAPEGNTSLIFNTNIASAHGEDSLEHTMAKELSEELNIPESDIICAYQYQLLWRKNEAKQQLEPVLQGDYEHTVLGSQDQEGAFHPLVTILNSSHPAITNPSDV